MQREREAAVTQREREREAAAQQRERERAQKELVCESRTDWNGVTRTVCK